MVLLDSAILRDFNPKSWLGPFQKKTARYLLTMALFYHAIGIILMNFGTFLALNLLPEYEVPSIPISFLAASLAGPIEETIFFGIPFYLIGNVYAVLGMGVFWSAVHIFNTEFIDVNNLAYGVFLFSVPHIFFSLRTWISGKGWFAVVFHSAWNVSFWVSFCAAGLRECTFFDAEQPLESDIAIIIIAASLVSIVYFLFKKRQNPQKKILYPITFSIAVFIIAEVYLLVSNPSNVFPSFQ